ncbi:hypothetical protein [Acetilactobacillus jinshanensis]|uniref:DUF2187 domain-containing protein n=1 Tax=Acetilactobacillus jinshanensis TaxID=1720083 RepID=A0A4P6ZM78_9LACO|nr:hypothetical protein [Acetilactobacillus jinshanensis]QBP18894.1 hypothetical protein ELX58_07315 [Acetilactobacillus jinshanensis]URL60557.1 hypothetical protein HGK75_00480 [uncultured bacterium]
MTIQDMGKNLLATQKKNQTVRIQSKNALYVGQVTGLNDGVLSLNTKKGAKKFNMQDVDNYKIMK